METLVISCLKQLRRDFQLTLLAKLNVKNDDFHVKCLFITATQSKRLRRFKPNSM